MREIEYDGRMYRFNECAFCPYHRTDWEHMKKDDVPFYICTHPSMKDTPIDDDDWGDEWKAIKNAYPISCPAKRVE